MSDELQLPENMHEKWSPGMTVLIEVIAWIMLAVGALIVYAGVADGQWGLAVLGGVLAVAGWPLMRTMRNARRLMGER